MEDQCSPLAMPFFFFEEEAIEELKQGLLYTTLELEKTIICANDEISKKDQEILDLKNLLAGIVKERDEFKEKCGKIESENYLLQEKLNRHFPKHLIGIAEAATGQSTVTTTTSTNEDQRTPSSSDSHGNNAVAFVPPPASVDATDKILPKLPLPEKGKFLKAVMEAGPLLQTLLVAGPLPEWQRPPPYQLKSIDIPPFTLSPTATQRRLLHRESALSGGGGKKRAAADAGCGSSSSSPSKSRRVSSSTAIISTT
ncbi:unnamed protein product [Cuscuta epithymum]|uniref:Uncharacterized protein n=1 Tax=Cuscuta epithymum TaxID=186058 RepID=A0AAV0F3T6_9ASTE|nr:unnamed protein product [Cuscuta epithymum]